MLTSHQTLILKRKITMKLAKIFILTSVFPATQALQAVIILTPEGGSITNHEVAPASGAPFSNVLKVLDQSNSSGVYIGGGWILTAKHVYNETAGIPVATVEHEGTAYTVDTTPGLTLDFSDATTYPTAPEIDLRLFRLETVIPGLPTISIGSVTAGDAITMIGRGDVGSSRIKRWGTNNVEAKNILLGLGDPVSRHVVAFSADYDTATTGEGGAIGGDSGGGVFHDTGSEWVLAGIMIAVDTAASPDITYSAQLDEYQSEIEAHIATHGSAIPEPSGSSLLMIAGFGFILRRTRRN